MLVVVPSVEVVVKVVEAFVWVVVIVPSSSYLTEVEVVGTIVVVPSGRFIVVVWVL